MRGKTSGKNVGGREVKNLKRRASKNGGFSIPVFKEGVGRVPCRSSPRRREREKGQENLYPLLGKKPLLHAAGRKKKATFRLKVGGGRLN